MPTHASSARSASNSKAAKTSTPMRLMRRLRKELRAQANMARKQARARWKAMEGQLEHPEKWVKRARKVAHRARHRVLGLRSELIQAWKNVAH